MDFLQFLSSAIGFLAWPVFIYLLIKLLDKNHHKAVDNLLGRVKSVKPTGVEFAADQIRDVKAELSAQGLKQIMDLLPGGVCITGRRGR